MKIYRAAASAERSDVQATQLPSAEGTVRFTELDSLRGLAAVTVVLSHFVSLWQWRTLPPFARAMFTGPLQLFLAAHSAVALFFVLSGFVLTLPTLAGRPQGYGEFLIRRVTRIYLPYLGALALAVGCDLLFRRKGIFLDDWFAGTWSAPVDWHLVWQHVLFLGAYNAHEYNTAFWTLVLEMRVSLFFPVLCFVMLRASRWLALLLLVSLFVVEGMLPEPATSHTIYAVSSFATGIVLARWYRPTVAWYGALSNIQRGWLLGAALFVYTYGRSMRHFPWPAAQLMEPLTTLSVVVVMLASVTPSWWRRFLLGAVPQWCGHISYSLYLLHSTILYSLVELAYGRIRLQWLLPVYLLLAFGMARMYFATVERPSMQLGRWLTRRECTIPKAGSALGTL